MKPTISSCLAIWLLALAQALAQPPALSQANQLEGQGHFREAAAVLEKELHSLELSNGDRQRLTWELDRLDRIKQDFSLTRDPLYSGLKKSVRGLTPEEYDRWIKECRFETRLIDGELRFMTASVGNLFFRYPELNSRRIPPPQTRDLQARHWEVCDAIKRVALQQHQPYVLPKRFATRMTLKVQADTVPAGETVRGWIPVPRLYPHQREFRIISADPALKRLDTEQSRIRSAYLEAIARPGKPIQFSLDYEYTSYGIWFDVAPEKVRAITPDDALKEFTAEGPHVEFTPQIRELSQQIAGTETNPFRQARKFYDWISEHIQYSYALEYSTVRNLSSECLQKNHGDCGQEALLFITLCRLNGIPARWQSGWNIFPGDKSIHDWSEIYLPPYGWIPVDPYMGIYARQLATSLTTEQRNEIRDFYFGGLDPYRLTANSDHNQELTPPKRSFRSDNVDFQRGELEWGNHNIYFDRFSYQLTTKELNLEP
jgi:transglutaminase-like putative cysteine protease